MKRILFLALILTGCGEESAPTSTPTANSTSAYDPTEFLATWRARCIDDNLPLVELRYEQCMNQQYEQNRVNCDPYRQENLTRLYAAWDWILATTEANYRQCMGDARALGDFCIGQYEFEVSFFVGMKCQSAATWH